MPASLPPPLPAAAATPHAPLGPASPLEPACPKAVGRRPSLTTLACGMSSSQAMEDATAVVESGVPHREWGKTIDRVPEDNAGAASAKIFAAPPAP